MKYYHWYSIWWPWSRTIVKKLNHGTIEVLSFNRGPLQSMEDRLPLSCRLWLDLNCYAFLLLVHSLCESALLICINSHGWHWSQVPQPGILAVLPRSPVQNPSADFLQSGFLFQNSPVSFKPGNLFYSQNVTFDTVKMKHKIYPLGCVWEFIHSSDTWH